MLRLPAVRKVVGSAYGTNVLATVAFSLVVGVTGVLATRALGPEERGLLATAVVWSSLAGSVSAYGTPMAASYFAARDKAEPPRSATTVIAISVAIGGVVATLGVVISLFVVPGDAATPMVIAFAGTLPDIVGGAAVGTVMGIGAYRQWGRLRLVAPLLSLSGVVVLVLLSGWQTAVAITTITAVAASIQLFFLLRAVAGHGLLNKPSAPLVRPTLAYMWRNIASGAGWLISNRLDLLVLSVFYPVADVGVYAVATSFGAIIVPIAGSTGNVVLTKVAAGGSDALNRTLVPALAGCLAIGGGFALTIVLIAPQMVPFLFGDGFANSVTPLRILMAGTVALCISSVLASALRGLGRPLEPARAELVGAITTLVLLPLLLPWLGIAGAALASTVSYTLVAITLSLSVRRARA